MSGVAKQNVIKCSDIGGGDISVLVHVAKHAWRISPDEEVAPLVGCSVGVIAVVGNLQRNGGLIDAHPHIVAKLWHFDSIACQLLQVNHSCHCHVTDVAGGSWQCEHGDGGVVEGIAAYILHLCVVGNIIGHCSAGKQKVGDGVACCVGDIGGEVGGIVESTFAHMRCACGNCGAHLLRLCECPIVEIGEGAGLLKVEVGDSRTHKSFFSYVPDVVGTR